MSDTKTLLKVLKIWQLLLGLATPTNYFKLQNWYGMSVLWSLYCLNLQKGCLELTRMNTNWEEDDAMEETCPVRDKPSSTIIELTEGISSPADFDVLQSKKPVAQNIYIVYTTYNYYAIRNA